MSDGRKTSWTPARRAAMAERAARRWRDPDYRARQSEIRRANALRPDQRAAASARATALNERMKTDVSIKGANLAGIYQSYLDGTRSAHQAATMKQTMGRPDQRARLAEHAAAINRDPAVREKQWEGRRGGKIPAGLEGLYRTLVRKVGGAEALRMVRDQAARR